MILQIALVDIKTFMNAKDNKDRIASKRIRLTSRLEAFTMGLFQNLWRAARQSNVTTTPSVAKVRITIPLALL